jgi:hypothetical protein
VQSREYLPEMESSILPPWTELAGQPAALSVRLEKMVESVNTISSIISNNNCDLPHLVRTSEHIDSQSDMRQTIGMCTPQQCHILYGNKCEHAISAR